MGRARGAINQPSQNPLGVRHVKKPPVLTLDLRELLYNAFMNIVRTTHRIEPRFVLDPFEPAYLSLLAEEIGSRVEAGLVLSAKRPCPCSAEKGCVAPSIGYIHGKQSQAGICRGRHRRGLAICSFLRRS